MVLIEIHWFCTKILKMKNRLPFRKIFHLLSISLLVFTGFIPNATTSADTGIFRNSKEQTIQSLLNQLSPEEKVGQLFLVGFTGNQVTTSSKIYDLIVNHHIGGVVLRSANDNFTGPESTLVATYEMVGSLQNAASSLASVSPNEDAIPEVRSNYIPLFIGISQEGDLAPNDQIINSLTPLPNELALGATWDNENALKAGSIIGQELSALGINLFLGPSLDVLDEINMSSGEDLGTRTFGGDPYWVGTLGKSFIRGVHQGSQWRMLVVAKNFPGRGGADRPPEEEVATVRKSLEQLKQIELAPFFTATGNMEDANELADGLLISHIRYQGFQGNIRATTKPVSFDSSALDQILNLEPLSNWRINGGILICDNLGSQAVRRFFDPTGNSFDGKMVANNAFLAGSDMLYVDTNFVSSGEFDSYSTIIKTIEFFTKKYNEDTAFAERVDQSVEKILSMKYRIYPNFDPELIMLPEDGLTALGTSQQVTFDIARQAATLISPESNELKNVLPRPPERRERIIFFTDAISSQQCSQCGSQTMLGTESLQNAVIKLYGQQASGQVINSHLSSYSFTALNAYLNDPAGNPDLDGNLQNAEWIVFSILNIDVNRPESFALIKFINSREDLIRDKKIVVFAFSAPYYLDATDISKISAYYGLYSKTSPFIEVAARILYQEHFPTGASPVSIPGIGYELIDAMSPDPEQIIQLAIDSPEISTSMGNTAEPTQTLGYYIGDNLPLRAGVITDRNHHPVPDGTIVKFIISINEEIGTSQQIESFTQGGIARAAYRISNPGLIQIRAISEDATISNVLQLQVSEGEAALITAIAPTPIPTSTAEVTATGEGDEEISSAQQSSNNQPMRFSTWLLSMIVLWSLALTAYWLGNQKVTQLWGVRWLLITLISGVMAYLLVAANLIDLTQWLKSSQAITLIGTSLFGGLIGFGLGWVWLVFDRRRVGQPKNIRE